jgi:hypothetical protein
MDDFEKDFNKDLVKETVDSADEIKNKVDRLLKFCLSKENTKLRNTDMELYKKLCMQEFTDFHVNSPTLFFSIVENPSTFPMYRLNEMLNVKKLIENNRITEDKASVALGQKYYNEFVKDTVGKLDNK